VARRSRPRQADRTGSSQCPHRPPHRCERARAAQPAAFVRLIGGGVIARLKFPCPAPGRSAHCWPPAGSRSKRKLRLLSTSPEDAADAEGQSDVKRITPQDDGSFHARREARRKKRERVRDKLRRPVDVRVSRFPSGAFGGQPCVEEAGSTPPTSAGGSCPCARGPSTIRPPSPRRSGTGRSSRWPFQRRPRRALAFAAGHHRARLERLKGELSDDAATALRPDAPAAVDADRPQMPVLLGEGLAHRPASRSRLMSEWRRRMQPQFVERPRLRELALLWHFQAKGLRTCLRQCGHR
jgi:hypothetical protein